MTLLFTYSDGTGTTQDLPGHVRLGRLAVSQSASLGVAEMSTLELDDPDASLDIKGLRRLYITESAAASNMLWTGYLADRSIARSPLPDSMRGNLLSRRWSLNMVDVDTQATFRVIRDTHSPKRPAETDEQRVQWLLDSGALYLVYNIDGFFTTGSPTDMDAVDYTGQTAADVLNDCSNSSGKNWFLYYSGTNQRINLWYQDSNTSTTYSSSVSLSNSYQDIDNSTIFGVNDDATITYDPSRVYSGVLMPYQGGSVYESDGSTLSTFGLREVQAPQATVSTATKAIALANRYLTDAESEDIKVHCTTWMPAANVNDIQAGMRVRAKFTHFPSPYNGFRWYRVLRRTVAQDEETNQTYHVSLDLSPQASTYTCPASQPFGSPTAADLFGGQISFGFNVPPFPGQGSYTMSYTAPATPPATAPTTITRGYSFPGAIGGGVTGSINNGSAFGYASTVSGGAATEYLEFVIDFQSTKRICMMAFYVTNLPVGSDGFYNSPAIHSSDDNSTWTLELDAAGVLASELWPSAFVYAPSWSPSAAHRYWRLSFSKAVTSGLSFTDAFGLGYLTAYEQVAA